MKYFVFFFCVPLPLIIYYADGHNNGGSSQAWSYIWLAVSVLLMLSFLKKYFEWLLLGRRNQIRQMEYLMQNGALISSQIMMSRIVDPEIEGVNKYELIVAFKNFSGSEVRELIYVNESHPEQHKYVEGKALKLRVDPELKNVPYLQVDGAHYDPPTSRAYFNGIVIYLFIVVGIIAYYFYAYEHEFSQPGWMFLVPYHPLIVCPLLLCVVMFFAFPSNKLTTDQLQHKFYGVSTSAQILRVTETGTFVNDRPQVRFLVRYADQNGKSFESEFTKMIGVLDVGLTQQKEIEIFYLPKNPASIIPATDIIPK